MSAPAALQSSGIAALLSGCTKLSKVIGAILLSGYIAQLIFPTTREYLALVAGRTLPCVWNVFTAGLLEVHIANVIFSVIAILVLAKVIEPIWGSKEFLKFIVIVNTAAGVGTFVVVVVAYAINRNTEGELLYTEISGFHGVLAGLLVAVKQIMPDTEVTLLGFIKFRAKLLPVIFIGLATLGTLILGAKMQTLPFILFGSYTAWFYLRFIQVKAETSLKGDPSDEFRFATFFPEVAHPLVDKVAGALSTLLRLNRPAAEDATKAYVMAGTPLPGSDAADASRRRERGARALEERLGMKATGEAKETPAAAPDIEAGESEEILPSTS